MLSENITKEQLSEMLLPKDSWSPFPKAKDRKWWENRPDEERSYVVSSGEKYLGSTIPILTASQYMEFQKNGERFVHEDPYFQRRSALSTMLLSECYEYKGRFIKDIIDYLWAICEESTWTISAHNKGNIYMLPNVNDPCIALFSACTAQLVAWVYYFLYDELNAISPRITERIKLELNERIYGEFLTNNDYFWMGLNGGSVNNWAPWIISNLLPAFLLVETNKEIRTNAVMKSLNILDNFINSYDIDGGCDEGPGYWFKAAGALLPALDYIMFATNNKLNWYSEEKIMNMAKFIGRMNISDNWFVNYADGSAKISNNGGILFWFGTRVNDDAIKSQAKRWNLKNSNYALNLSFGEILPSLMCLYGTQEMKNYSTSSNLENQIYLQGIQLMVSRESTTENTGFVLSTKGGNNNESHNHNDLGTLILFNDGEPVLIDVGVTKYTKQTFSAQRYSIWCMQSSWHNLPDIDNMGQLAGKEYCTKNTIYSKKNNSLTSELRYAYPKECRINSFIRTTSLDTENSLVTINDVFEPTAPINIEEHFITLYKPELIDNGLQIKTIKGTVTFKINQFKSINVDEVIITDNNLSNVWGDKIYRTTIDLGIVEDIVNFNVEIT